MRKCHVCTNVQRTAPLFHVLIGRLAIALSALAHRGSHLRKMLIAIREEDAAYLDYRWILWMSDIGN
jgi:hypothetical protein